ncbi:hypothetical protein VaNZ11_001120 [Volvox africanus]|uniref:Seipin n=1 Tax=Volvox africanus TaxID=51714 RepID=A0ABQ5RQA3_9CHLO|nr:hypothetical protein VaNZ11_001120 [Volvox africanus]
MTARPYLCYIQECALTSFHNVIFRSSMLCRLTRLVPAAVTCGALLSFLLALLGYSSLGFLYLTRRYAPASDNYVRPLHFDYTGYVAVAWAPMSPNLREQAAFQKNLVLSGSAANLLPRSQFLPSGSQVAVHVVLTIPADHTDLFQVTGDLMTNTTYIAARSTRTYINTPKPYLYRLAKQLIFMPLHVLGWGNGDWAHVDLQLFDEYEYCEDAPVTMFRARLSSRNASRGGLPPPPVHRAELHVRLRLGFFRTALFWLRPGLVASVVLLLIGLMASISGTVCGFALLIVAFFLRRWIAKSVAEREKGKLQRGALPPALARSQPYRKFADAVTYSLTHGQYYRGGVTNMVMATTEQDDISSPFGMQASNRAIRQVSSSSEALKACEANTKAAGGDGSARIPLIPVDSAAWSGSSSEASTYNAGGLAAPAAPSTVDTVPTDKRPGSTRTSSLPMPPAAAEDKEREGASSPAARGAGRGQAAAAPSAMPTDSEQPSVANGGSDAPEQAGDSAGQDLDRNVSIDESSEDFAGSEQGQQEYGEQGSVANGKSPGMAREGSPEGQFSDLEPQADNEAVGSALRRRAVFAWKA